jgi:hypothetical protein
MFLLSFWRDEGAILTLGWLLAWVYYWKRFQNGKSNLIHVNERLIIMLLATAVVHFSLAPPSVGERLLVAIVLGASFRLIQELNSSKKLV